MTNQLDRIIENTAKSGINSLWGFVKMWIPVLYWDDEICYFFYHNLN